MKLQGEPLQHQEGVAGVLLPLPWGACAEFEWRRGNEEESGHTEELGKTPFSAILAFSHTKYYVCIVTVVESNCALFVRPLCHQILSILYLFASLEVAITGDKE